MPPRINRLASQTSPYLLQHAHNPVDWYPWGEEAFAEARRRDVPIFLSVGYSTCYWCHVMERESFEDEATARVMNEHFVCIKVDREERPDVDDLYMVATQMYTGRGGWPMSVMLEPQGLRPFWAGTYFPPEPRHGLPAFTHVLESLARAWREQREEVLRQAETLAGAVRDHLGTEPARAPIGRDQVAHAVASLLRSHDRAHGGFGGEAGPKFPQPAYLDLLMAFRRAASDEEARRAVDAAVRLTLDRMACGGIFDQVGGGFHRYSVDGRWVVPHFEKMLYDNGQLAATYATAASVLGDAFYARTTRRILDYVLREMMTEEGAFASAQDAEVSGREGLNYLWTREQMIAALGPDDGAWAAKVYGLDAGPNFRDPHHPEDEPANVLLLAARPEELARREGVSTDEFLARLDAINERLEAERGRRPQPHRDDKVLCGWNGLMIAGLAEGSIALGDDRYRDAAERAAAFILATMQPPGGRGGLFRVYRAGVAHTEAVLEDYALLVRGLLALYRSGGAFKPRWLRAIEELLAAAEARFADGSGGYYDTTADRPDLFIRARSTYDGAVPSGVSVMINNLLDLHEITGEERYLDRAAACLDAISGAIAASPVSTANSTLALLRLIVTPGGERRLASRAAPVPAAAPASPAAPEEPLPLEVYASTDRVAVKEGDPAGFVAEIVIRDGLHLIAADPGEGAAGLAGARFEIAGGAGVNVYADWPAGEPYGGGGQEGGVLAYTGRVTVPVLLERAGEWVGRPILVLRYQACTDTECLAPGAVELAVAIDRG